MKNTYFTPAVKLCLALSLLPTSALASTADTIYNAAKNGQTGKINYIINSGYSVDTPDNSGSTALCKAYADRNMRAYNLLLQYGANPYASCMYATKTGPSFSSKYVWGGLAVVGAGAAIAAAAGGGGGGGGGGHNSTLQDSNSADNNGSQNNNDENQNENTEGTWTTGDNEDVVPGDGYSMGETWLDDDSGGSWSTGGENDDSGGGSDEGGSGGSWSTGGGNDDSGGGSGNNDNTDDTYEKAVNYFQNNREYNGSNFGGYGLTSVNYMDAINAAKAYAHFTDANGNFTASLTPVTVGIVDTGVWANHSEFALNNGSKVSGYNYDYGPCRNGDYKNCWRTVKTITRTLLVFSHSKYNGDVYNSNMSAQDIAKFNTWASYYPDDYDWDTLDKTNVSPNQYATGNQSMHGTHVAALIAGNKDNKGMMGVAYQNALIKAVRWDFQSSIEEPIQYLINNGAKIINLSMGLTSTSNTYNANTITQVSQINSDFVSAMRAVLAKNTVTNNGKIDGVIVVKAAGNENVNHPDTQAGIKRFAEFKNLQMLVVTAVDVALNADGTVNNYHLSAYANKCGITGTKGYCIAAPGGDYTDDAANVIYSAGQPDVNGGYYATVGTSQATPIVSGSLAFLLGVYPYMSAEEVIDLVKETANHSATDYSPETYGAGLLDLDAAITKPVPISNSVNLATYSGNSVNSALINLDNAAIYVPASLQNSLLKALPASITVFDRYKRPFAINTARFVHTTHSGYKSLKNDVVNIANSNKIITKKEGNFSFAMLPSSLQNQNNNMGMMAMEYKQGKHSSGFYFSENTAYKKVGAKARELNNPFMSFTNAYGVNHSYNFSRRTALHFEAMTGRNGLYDGDRDFNDNSFNKQAYAVNMALDIHKNQKYTLTLSSGLLYEDEAMLGLNGDGAFALKGANTYTAGITAAWHPTKRFTLSGSYYRGWTEPQTFSSNMLRTTKLESSSFALEADYQSNKTTHLGLRFSSPLYVEKGRLKVDVAGGRDNYSDTIYRQTYSASLKPQKREYKLAAYWHREFTEDLSLRTETGVRFHPEHQTGKNDYRMLVGLSWNFN